MAVVPVLLVMAVVAVLCSTYMYVLIAYSFTLSLDYAKQFHLMSATTILVSNQSIFDINIGE